VKAPWLADAIAKFDKKKLDKKKSKTMPTAESPQQHAVKKKKEIGP
jgi:hypothetical protein